MRRTRTERSFGGREQARELDCSAHFKRGMELGLPRRCRRRCSLLFMIEQGVLCVRAYASSLSSHLGMFRRLSAACSAEDGVESTRRARVVFGV